MHGGLLVMSVAAKVGRSVGHGAFLEIVGTHLPLLIQAGTPLIACASPQLPQTYNTFSCSPDLNNVPLLI